MSSTLKIPLFMAGATATAGIGALAAKELSSPKDEKTISSLLATDPSKRSIADSEDEAWKQAWELYKKSKKDIWRLGEGADVPLSLKTTCKRKLTLKVSGKDSEGYREFLSYCTRDTLVSDLIKEHGGGRELLVKGNGSDGDWKAVWKSYGSDSRNATKTANGDIWKLGDWNSKHSEQNAPDTFMNKCIANAKEPVYEVSNQIYIDTLAFCTKAKTESVRVNG
ncbi:hypothetical protein HF1_12340 [Mycoplasma haemofelis str. Langford 1]|uniref:Uncharacterized protein n=1 Tax=Mycoplasma haemofelis (strain Langford 1) TaxID=941640 RepID=E8ZJC1_MYCHL|nr:hypothetical protein [Mycoplasma haemofelis]CBY93242.1 hypothetical protein HF1_12340 [Mycoplasma haemofelis str. Langford 1]